MGLTKLVSTRGVLCPLTQCIHCADESTITVDVHL